MQKRGITLILAVALCVGAFVAFNQSAASKTSSTTPFRETAVTMPLFATTLDVDRTDDTAAATACTPAANDCSLRGAIINANADLSATPVTSAAMLPKTTKSAPMALVIGNPRRRWFSPAAVSRPLRV